MWLMWLMSKISNHIQHINQILHILTVRKSDREFYSAVHQKPQPGASS